jgi:hypothetical protein
MHNNTHKSNIATTSTAAILLQIAMVDSNVIITCPDALMQAGEGGEKFGAYIKVAGGAAARAWQTAMFGSEPGRWLQRQLVVLRRSSRLLLAGTATAQIQGLAMRYCGQAGMERGCITFDATRTSTAPPTANSSLAGISLGDPLSSFIRQSANVHGMDSSLLLKPSVTAPVLVDGNVVSVGLAH